MSPFLFLTAGLAVGAVLGWFIAQSRSARVLAALPDLEGRARQADEAKTALAVANARMSDLEVRASQAEEARTSLAAAGARMAVLEQRLAEQVRADAVREEEATRLRHERQQTAERLARAETELQQQAQAHAKALQEVTQARDEMISRFREVAADALAKNNEQFLQNAGAAFEAHRQMASSELDARKAGIDQMLTPLRLGLGEMNKRVEEVEKARAEAYGQLGEQLRALSEAQLRLDTSTTQLATALRSGSARGRWGELHLRQLLEGSGLLDYADFSEQVGVTGSDGQRQRPDVIVRLPGERSIAVDSKVPLDDYLNAFDATDEATRSQWLNKHTAKVRDHARALADRKYWESIEGSPPLVVLFLPTDALLADALRCDPALLDTCHRQQVVIATPSTLFAMLKSIGQLWQQEKLTKEVGEIQKLGKELYDRIGILAEHFEKVGKSLTQATRAYNDAVGSFESSLLVTARKLKDKGASTSRLLIEAAPVAHEVRPFVKTELRGG